MRGTSLRVVSINGSEAAGRHRVAPRLLSPPPPDREAAGAERGDDTRFAESTDSASPAGVVAQKPPRPARGPPPAPTARRAVFPRYEATRYVTPLREGGSLPAVLDTDGGLFVTKFRGAGQGARALVAELVVGGLARRLGLAVPDLALVHLDEAFGRAEPDPEIQDILNGSRGLNVGLRYLDGAFGFDAVAVGDLVPPDEAAAVVWLDALVTNVDRTPRNPNLLWAGAGGPLHLIDHGAALYFHHDWEGLTEARAQAAFLPIRDHVLLPLASDVLEADERLAQLVTEGALSAVLAAIPDALLMDAPPGRAPAFPDAEANRAAYLGYFRRRLAPPRRWAAAAEEARRALADAPSAPLAYRR